MPREVIVGIILTGKDAATSVFKGVVGGAKSVGSAVGDLSEKARKSFGDFKQSVIALNQGLELVKKGIRAIDSTVGDAIRKNLEMRSAQDETRRSVESFRRSIDVAIARVGQFFIPIVRGVIDVFGPLLKRFDQWAKSNQNMVQGNLIQWMVRVADTMVDGIAWGALQVTRAWLGWKMVVSTVEAAVNKSFATILDGIGYITDGLGRMAKAVGLDSLAEGVGGVSEFVKGLGAEFDASGDKAIEAIMEEMRQLEAAEAAINKVKGAVKEGIGQVAVAAFKHVGESVTFVNEKLEALRGMMLKAKAAAAEYQQMIANFHAEARMARLQQAEKESQRFVDSVLNYEIDSIAKLNEAWAVYYSRRSELSVQAQNEIQLHLTNSARELTKTTTSELATTFESVAGSLKGILMSSFANVKTVGEGIRNLFTNIGKYAAESLADYLVGLGVKKAAEEAAALFSIQSSAAAAAAGAAESQAGIPVVGPFLAVAAMAAMFAAVMAFAGKFHQGGILPGRRGQEIPFVGQAGEMIIPMNQVPAAMAMGFGPQTSAAVPMPVQGMGGGGPTIVIQQNLMATQGKTDIDRNLNESLLPVIQKWIDSGRLRT